MQDIQLIIPNTPDVNFRVQFSKKLWHENEIMLAKCYNFVVEIESGIITADLRITSQRALFEFIKFSFKNFSESPMEEGRKNAFFQQIESAYKQINDYVENIIRAKLPYYDGHVTGHDGKNYTMYIHQKDTVRESFFKKYNFLALDRRLGKTLISASISRIHNIRRTVIVCPSIAKWNAWFRDLTSKFGYNELFFTVLDASRKRTIMAFNERFVIINYDILEKYMKELTQAEIGHFIFDECHKIKNTSTQRFKNIKKIVDQFPEARITFLSGTPISNRVNDLFSYLKLSHHEMGQNYKKFCDTYTIKGTGRGGDRITGSKNLNDLQVKLFNFMIRKRKEDCIDVPKQTYTSYVFKLDDYKEEYNRIIAEMAKQKSITNLNSSIHSLNIVTAKAKMKGIIDLAEDILDNEPKVVIFSNYTEPIEILQRHFGNRCVVITGSVESWKRDGIIEKFKNDPKCEVFIGNMQAAGEGINLAFSNEIIVVDFPMVPSTLAQACDRCIEIGKKETINVNYTFCEDSVDEHLFNLIVEKQVDISAVIDDGADVLVREDIREILIKKLLEKYNEEVPNSETNDAVAQEEVREETTASTKHAKELQGEVHSGLRSDIRKPSSDNNNVLVPNVPGNTGVSDFTPPLFD